MLIWFIVTWLIIAQQIRSVFTRCPTDRSWDKVKQPKELINFLGRQAYIELENEESGSHTLKFVNWQQRSFQLACPDPKNIGSVKEWKHRYFPKGPESDDVKERHKEFLDTQHKSTNITVKGPLTIEYFATYSCLMAMDEEENCWHHFYVVVKPSPVVKLVKENGNTYREIQIPTGTDGSFGCWLRGNNSCADTSKIPVNMPLTRIEWIFPHSGNSSEPYNVEINDTNVTVNGSDCLLKSTVKVTGASEELNAGIHECILIDKFGVSSHPDDDELYQRVYLKSEQERYTGFAHVHVRSWTKVFIPIGITLVLCCILPLMVKFLPTAANEADLEEEDDDGPKQQENEVMMETYTPNLEDQIQIANDPEFTASQEVLL